MVVAVLVELVETHVVVLDDGMTVASGTTDSTAIA